MARFIINGGHPVGGSITPVGNKNAALPMLAACLLTDQPVTLRNLPLIDDVRVMLELLRTIGVSVEVKGHTVTLCAASCSPDHLDGALCRKVRGSILLAGPLLTRVKKLTLSPPGGDVIGRRRLDTHLHGFTQLGATVSLESGIELKRKVLKAASIVLDEASVTATENLVMTASLTKGTTTLYHAACEPHVQDLCRLLISMGASIEGVGTNRLTIRGRTRLKGTSYRIAPDYIEAGSLMAVAAATGGTLTLKGIHDPDIHAVMLRGFEKLGLHWEVKGKSWIVKRQSLKVLDDIGDAVPKFEDGPWPGFPSDLMSVAIVLATQASGTVVFFEKMFESRMYFVDRLIEMGARIVPCDPHRVVVAGPSRLQGSLLTSPDIRAGMALVIAALCAKGESVIDNAQMIDRGYENIERRLRSLGAHIVREP